MHTTSNPWDHLPNAKHIDRIIALWDQYPDIWQYTWDKWLNLIGYELRDHAWVKAWAKCKELDRRDIWTDQYTPDIDSMLALFAYDDCAHYLEYTSQELTTIALLGVTPAILLLRAVLAFEEIAKLEATT